MHMCKFLIPSYLLQTYASKAMLVCVVSRDMNTEETKMILAIKSSDMYKLHFFTNSCFHRI